MDLQKTINELEAQAAQYTEAAKSLRSLLSNGQTAPAVRQEVRPTRTNTSTKPQANKTSGKTTDKAKATDKGNGRRAMSPETRAKLSAAAKARHAAKRAGA